MSPPPVPFEIHEPTYQWSIRLFRLLRRMVKVNLKLHAERERVVGGDIFLFNHFARFETFIPQFLIYERCGAYCRSVASAEFFAEDDLLGDYLRRVGAVPTDHDRLLALLAAEILRGRKVIVFPEGGMVKDRRVLDDRGRYNVYSRIANTRRKHHTGAAVLALMLDAFKGIVLESHRAGDERRLQRWVESLQMPGVRALLEAARRPTTIVPANITFYPIRVSDNLLRKGVEMFKQGVSRRLSEELLIEGNILLRDTDMDIRFGAEIRLAEQWHWWERQLVKRLSRRTDDLDELFALSTRSGPWDARALALGVRRHTERVRDQYMHRMYEAVTINLSHLASTAILALLERGEATIALARFHRILYLAVKYMQAEPGVHLHRSLRNPEHYGRLHLGVCSGLDQFLRTAVSSGLVAQGESTLELRSKLRTEHEFDEVRIENLIEVYANEAAPVATVAGVVNRAIADESGLGARALAELTLADEQIALEWDTEAFSRPRHRALNEAEHGVRGTAAPFVSLDGATRALGVVLVHGFLSSPAEMAGLGTYLGALGYPLVGVRLKGHGTSPWDLRERAWEDWLESVRAGYEAVAAYADAVAVVGFSTGGALAIRLAADAPARLAGCVGACVPMQFRSPTMSIISLVHQANRLVRRISSLEGVKPFHPNHPENPHINYHHIPVRGLHELTRLVDELNRRAGDVRCPVLLLQGDTDPVVHPKSLEILTRRLAAARLDVHRVQANHHGIIYRNTGGTHERIAAFLDALEAGLPSKHPPPAPP